MVLNVSEIITCEKAEEFENRGKESGRNEAVRCRLLHDLHLAPSPPIITMYDRFLSIETVWNLGVYVWGCNLGRTWSFHPDKHNRMSKFWNLTKLVQ